MTTSTSRLAYKDCYEVMDKALVDDLGLRVKVKDVDAAYHLRMRMHTARTIARKENQQVFEEGHPMYGRSPYDILVLRIKSIKDTTYLYLEKNQLPTQMEPLSEVEETKQIEGPAEPLMIEHFTRRV